MTKNKTTILNRQLGRIHPLVATAAVAVTLVSLVGVAAITGVLPNSHGTTASAAATTTQAQLMSPPQTDTRMMPNEPVATNSTAPAYVTGPVSKQYDEPAAPPVIKHAAPRKPVTHVPTQNPNYAPQQSQQSEQQYDRDYQVAQGPAVCRSCGRVESIVAQREPVAQGSGVGVAAGAVLGGILGNQVGSGNGRTLATVAGAVAGGYGGNEVEKRTRSTTTYRVRVRMEDGEIRTFPQTGNGWQVGDRVRVVNGALTSRG
ncbi:MAG: glycine zipper 2TM domain-containing protein [Herminiimonas sp.]|nr:glycine zipper 2TM domain-containing protein [Herminiimonas sp.]